MSEERASDRTWAALFERAATYDVSEADVREALAARREVDDA